MILIIGHEASLTGAPKFLLGFCRWLKNEKNEKIIFLLKEGGPLLDSYREVALTYVCYRSISNKNLITTIWNRILNLLKIRFIVFFLRREKIKLILSNTLLNGDILEKLRSLNVPIITRVPELEYVIRNYWQYNLIQRTLRYSNHFIAVSQAVKDNLIKNHNIPTDKIDLCYGFVSQLHVNNNSHSENIRKKMDIPDRALLIGACGNPEWRKGPDLFIEVARKIIIDKKIDNVYFIWIGGNIKSVHYLEVKYELEKLSIYDKVYITGEVENPSEYYKCLDIFLMTSREDPFPLVNIEAAFFGLPIICFDKSGGSPEFVTEDIGFVVDYGDTNAMAERLIQLIENKELRKKLGDNIKKKADEYTLEKRAHMLYDIITKWMK